MPDCGHHPLGLVDPCSWGSHGLRKNLSPPLSTLTSSLLPTSHSGAFPSPCPLHSCSDANSQSEHSPGASEPCVPSPRYVPASDGTAVPPIRALCRPRSPSSTAGAPSLTRVLQSSSFCSCFWRGSSRFLSQEWGETDTTLPPQCPSRLQARCVQISFALLGPNRNTLHAYI